MSLPDCNPEELELLRLLATEHKNRTFSLSKGVSSVKIGNAAVRVLHWDSSTSTERAKALLIGLSRKSVVLGETTAWRVKPITKLFSFLGGIGMGAQDDVESGEEESEEDSLGEAKRILNRLSISPPTPGSPPPPPDPRPKLFDHQNAAISASLSYFSPPQQLPASALLTMACGSGKTRVAAELMARYSTEGHCAIIVPGQALADQTHERLELFFGSSVHLVKEKTSFSPGTMGGGSAGGLIVCVYNSAWRLKELPLALVVLDEAHHLYEDEQGPEDGGDDDSWADTVSSLKARRRIFMTATSDKLKMQLDPPLEIYRYDMGDAIKDKHTLDYVVYYGNTRGNIVDETMQFLKDTEKRMPTHVMSFSSEKKLATQLAEKTFSPDPYFNSRRFLFHGDISKVERDSNLQRFSSADTALLCACKMGGEGIDMANIDAVVFDSKGQIDAVRVIQSLGRTLRKGGTWMSGILRCNRSNLQLTSVVTALTSYDSRLCEAAKCGDLDFIKKHFKSCDSDPSLENNILEICKKALKNLDLPPSPPRFTAIHPKVDTRPPLTLSPSSSSPPRVSRSPSPGLSSTLGDNFDLEEDRRKAAEKGFLYFIIAESETDIEGKYFKIGRSVDPDRRLKALRTGNHLRLVIKKRWNVEQKLCMVESRVLQAIRELPSLAKSTSGGTEWFRLESGISFEQILQIVNLTHTLQNN